jgi:hypothetical protein
MRRAGRCAGSHSVRREDQSRASCQMTIGTATARWIPASNKPRRQFMAQRLRRAVPQIKELLGFWNLSRYSYEMPKMVESASLKGLKPAGILLHLRHGTQRVPRRALSKRHIGTLAPHSDDRTNSTRPLPTGGGLGAGAVIPSCRQVELDMEPATLLFA